MLKIGQKLINEKNNKTYQISEGIASGAFGSVYIAHICQLSQK